MCRCGRMDIKYGEVCSSCGQTQNFKATKSYCFFLSKADSGKWKRCDEAYCRQMAAIGYEVKKVVVQCSQNRSRTMSDGAVTCRCGYVELDPGETCPFCGFGVQKFYYFSKVTNRWILCRTESFCRRMADEGCKVKMVKV